MAALVTASSVAVVTIGAARSRRHHRCFSSSFVGCHLFCFCRHAVICPSRRHSFESHPVTRICYKKLSENGIDEK
ncbi:hypothetical protein AHAS_Ahas20G0125300 [Arachis hypogaea]